MIFAVEPNTYLVFVALSTAVIVVPGPSILLIVSNTLQLGFRGGLSSVIGISVAMAIQLAIAVMGITSLVALLAPWLAVLRWLGIAYLAWLGIGRWRSVVPIGAFELTPRRRYGSAFGEGFLVSLTNPTTMLFFIAFFPQFLTNTAPAGRQLILMSTTFWALALVFDVAYAYVSAWIGHTLQDPKWAVLRNRLSGAIMVLAALALALVRA